MSMRVPKLRLHKASGQAFVELGGRRFYCGKHGTPASVEKYQRLVAEWLLRGGQPLAPPAENTTGLSINELTLQFCTWAKSYYAVEGKVGKEFACLRDALRPLKDLFGLTPANQFGPKSLKTVRQHMIDGGLCRRLINQRIGRIKRMFKWGVAEELIAPSVYHGLQAVVGLQFGRSAARENEPVKPVPDLHVALVLPFVAPQVRALILLQRLTGMRPGEAVIMQAKDIDTTGEVWIYSPIQHKNLYRGHARTIPLGPQAQEILRPFMSGEHDYLFSPKEAEAWRYEQRPPYVGRQRKTPVYPSELRRREQKKQAKRPVSRTTRDHYDVDSYRRAITYGMTRAKRAGFCVPTWHPHQLRHSRATEIRRAHGLEASKVSLGHARVEATEIYAERDMEVAVRIARQTG